MARMVPLTVGLIYAFDGDAGLSDLSLQSDCSADFAQRLLPPSWLPASQREG